MIENKGINKIFMVGHFGARNIGDELILLSQAYLFYTKLPNVSFFIYSYSKNSDYYRTFPFQYELIKGFSVKEFFSSLISILKGVKESDLIIIGGGGILQDKYFSYRPLSTLLPAFLGFLLNKKVYGFSLGIYSFSYNFNKKLVLCFLRYANWVAVRDKTSLESITNIGKTFNYNFSNVSKIPDSVVSLPVKHTSQSFAKHKYLTFVARDEFISVVAEVSTIIKFIADKLSLTEIKLICFENDASEIELMNKIKESLINQKCTQNIVIHQFPIVTEYLCLLENTSFMISGRLHGCVSSYIYSKPVLAFSYEDKMMDFCKSHNIPVFEKNKIDEIELENIDLTYSNRSVTIEKKELEEFVDYILDDNKTYKISNFNKLAIGWNVVVNGTISILKHIV